MKNSTNKNPAKIVNSKFKIYTLTEKNVKAGEHVFKDESLDILHASTFTFHCDNDETYKKNFQEALKAQIASAEKKVQGFLQQESNRCLHKHVYFCSEACYPDSTIALEYNSNLDPNIIHETKYGVLISKIDFNL